MQIQFDFYGILQYLLLYFVIATGGSAWGSFLGNDLFILIIFSIGALFLVFYNKGLVEKKYGITIILCTLFCFSAMCYSSLSIGTYLNFMGKILLAFAAIKIDEEHFADRFIRISCFLALISCIMFFAIQIFGLESFAPLYTKLYTNPLDGEYSLGNGYGLLLFRFIPLHSYRNSGMFTEPGEYAVPLAVALFFVIANYENMNLKSRDKKFLLLVLTMITTQSTSGYGMLAVILIVAFFSKKIAVLHSSKLWITVGVVFLIFGGYFLTLYDNTITNKILVDGAINLNQGTAAARSMSITDVLAFIGNHPTSLLGIGFEKMQSAGIGACAGILAVLLAVGIFAFTTFYGYLLVAGWENANKMSLYLIMISILLISGLSQPGTGFAVCYLMFMAKVSSTEDINALGDL